MSSLKQAIEGIEAINNMILHGNLSEREQKMLGAAVIKITGFVYQIKDAVVGK